MADWPDTDELGKVLDVDPESSSWDDTLEGIMASAIRKVQVDCSLAEEDDPTEAQRSAALRMGELMAQRPGSPVRVLSLDATYQAHVYGSRQRWGLG